MNIQITEYQKECLVIVLIHVLYIDKDTYIHVSTNICTYIHTYMHI